MGRATHEVLVAWPRDPPSACAVALLLHGLAETRDEHEGARAWLDRYGLAASVDRAPRGLVFVCPFVPRMGAKDLDPYARWLTGTLVPRVREELGALAAPGPPRVAGCSYGGWVALEAFLLEGPDAFAAFAGVQSAIGRAAAASYAERIARAIGDAGAARPLLLETSTLDPFRDANVALGDALRARGVAVDVEVLPGPHDQAWLRSAGTPRLVAWLDRI
jgi:acetyl esterase/lipase